MTHPAEGAYDGAVFVQTRTRPPGTGPFAPMLTAAGWAAASAARWGNGWVWTPGGALSPDQARAAASVPADVSVSGQRAGWRPPEWAVTFAKDARAAVRGLGRHAPVVGPWDGARVPFVWQRHDPFQSVGFDIAAGLDRPVVLSVHALHVDEARAWGVRRPGWGWAMRSVGELRVMRRASLITAVSEEVAASMRGYLPSRAADVVVIGGGIDTSHFRRDPVSGLRIRETLGIPADDLVIGWHGSFRKFHWLDGLLRAYARARADLPRCRVLLVGHGPERARLRALAEELRIGDDLVSPGEVAYADIPAYLSAMDIGLVVSDAADTFHYSPLKLREYQACSLPVIASRAGEMQLLQDGVDAVLVTPGDERALADALVEVAGSAEVRERLSARGPALAERHSWDARLGQLVDELTARRLLA